MHMLSLGAVRIGVLIGVAGAQQFKALVNSTKKLDSVTKSIPGMRWWH